MDNTFEEINVIEETEKISNLLLDTVIQTNVVSYYGCLYKEKNKFKIVIFDVMGAILNAGEFQPEENDDDLIFHKFTPSTIAFCKLTIRDVFTDTEILGSIEVDESVDDYMTVQVKANRQFFKEFYDGLYERFVTQPIFN